MNENDVLENIIDQMAKKRYNQVKLCKELGINKNIFSDWKARRSRSYMDRIFQIAEILECSVDELLGKKCDGNMTGGGRGPRKPNWKKSYMLT